MGSGSRTTGVHAVEPHVFGSLHHVGMHFVPSGHDSGHQMPHRVNASTPGSNVHDHPASWLSMKPEPLGSGSSSPSSLPSSVVLGSNPLVLASPPDVEDDVPLEVSSAESVSLTCGPQPSTQTSAQASQ
jgi:hypothetical protein